MNAVIPLRKDAEVIAATILLPSLIDNREMPILYGSIKDSYKTGKNIAALALGARRSGV